MERDKAKAQLWDAMAEAGQRVADAMKDAMDGKLLQTRELGSRGVELTRWERLALATAAMS